MDKPLFDHLVEFLSINIEDAQIRKDLVRDALAGLPVFQTLINRYYDPATPDDVIKAAQLRAVQQVLQVRATRYNDRDVETLVRLGRLGEALSYARLRPTYESKFQSLLSIWEVLRTISTPDSLMALKQLRQEILDELPLVAGFVHFKIFSRLLDELIKESSIQPILATIRTIETLTVRVSAIAFMAQKLINQNHNQAMQLLSEAEQVAHQIKSDEYRFRALLDLITIFAENQQHKEAERLTFSFPEEWKYARLLALSVLIEHFPRDYPHHPRFLALAQAICDSAELVDVQDSNRQTLAYALAEGQQFQQSERIALLIRHQDRRGHALDRLARALEKNQRYMESARIILLIPTQWIQESAWNDLSQELSNNQQYAKAARVALRIKKTEKRIEALSKLAQSLVETGHDDDALRLIPLVLEGSRNLSDTDVFGRLWILYTLIGPMVQLGQAAEAEHAARSIRNSLTQGAALRTLAVELAEREHYTEAERVAFSIQDATQRTETFSLLAHLLAQKGHADTPRLFNLAENTSQYPERDYWWAKKLQFVVQTLAWSYQYVEAERVALSLEDLNRLGEALRELAKILGEHQRYAEAERIALSIEHTDRRGETLNHLAELLIHAAHPDRDRIFALAEEASGGIQEVSLSHLVSLLPRVKHPDPMRLLRSAEQVSRSIEHVYGRANALQTLVTAFGESQYYADAERLALSIEKSLLRETTLASVAKALGENQQYSEAERIIRSIEHLPTGIDALSTLAQQLAQSAHPHQDRIFRLVEKICLNIEEPSIRSKALQSFATALAQSQRYTKAESIARTIESSDSESWALQSLVKSLWQHQQYAEAERIALTIKDPYNRKYSLKSLTESLAQDGQYTEAERIARLIDDPHDQTETLKSLIRVMGENQRYGEAERIALSIDDPDRQVEALVILVRCMIQVNYPDRDRLFILIESICERVDDQDHSLQDLVWALTDDQKYEKAELIARTITYEQDLTLKSLASGMAAGGSFIRAFRVVPHCSMLDYVSTLCNWCAEFEAVETGLFLNVLRVTLPILAWEQPQ